MPSGSRMLPGTHVLTSVSQCIQWDSHTYRWILRGLMSNIEVGSAELAVTASWVRGGTSKCWIFQAADVDALPVTRDEFLLRAFGSPDLRQIDGIGGGNTTARKGGIVEAPPPGPA